MVAQEEVAGPAPSQRRHLSIPSHAKSERLVIARSRELSPMYNVWIRRAVKRGLHPPVGLRLDPENPVGILTHNTNYILRYSLRRPHADLKADLYVRAWKCRQVGYDLVCNASCIALQSASFAFESPSAPDFCGERFCFVRGLDMTEEAARRLTFAGPGRVGRPIVVRMPAAYRFVAEIGNIFG